MTTIIIGLLPLIEKLGMWWIDYFFKSQAEKQAAQDAFMILIKLHQGDGVTSAEAFLDYRRQLDQLQKSIQPPGPKA